MWHVSQLAQLDYGPVLDSSDMPELAEGIRLDRGCYPNRTLLNTTEAGSEMDIFPNIKGTM